MWQSRDLTLIIVFAALGLVYTVFVVQMSQLMTGVSGVAFLLIIGYAIFISSQLLLYEGRRWRFLVSTVLFVLLSIPTSFPGAPFDLLARTPLIFNAIIGDLLFNSAYGFFKRRKKLLLLILSFSILYNSLSPVFSMILYYFFYPPGVLTTFINVFLLLLPVIIIESVAGGYVGYNVYERLKDFKSMR